MSNGFKQKDVKYLGRDFQTSKRMVMDFLQAHHSGAFRDFNESSPGMAIVDVLCYIGDQLSYYQDMQFEELRGMAARQLDVVTDMAKLRGYKPSGKRASTGVVTLMCEVPATTIDGQVTFDPLYCPIIRRGSQLSAINGVIFETLSDVHFSASAPTEDTTTYLITTGSQFDATTGVPTHFALRKDVRIMAGETKTESFTIGSFEKHKTLELSSPDVIEVLKVEDSDGNEWFEVNYLTEEFVFDSTENSEADNSLVPYIMRLKSVPRRFFTDRNPTSGKTSLIFGSGDGVNFNDELIPNIANFALPINGRMRFTSYAIDPQNFLKTSTLGLSPYNTTITVTYRTGGGSQTNVQEGAINIPRSVTVNFSSTGLDPQKMSDVENSIECINLDRTDGGGPEESIEEIKANAAAFFAAQNRAVTREDYLARVLSLPARFGRVEKAFVKNNSLNQNAVDIHLLARDENGFLTQASTNLIKNVKTYLGRYRMMTEGVNLLTTTIINFGIDFGVVVSPKYNRGEVLAKCLNAIKNMFVGSDAYGIQTCNMTVGEPIVIDDIVKELKEISGVVTIYNVKFKNIFGTHAGLTYGASYDMSANTHNGIIYCPDNAIFELKYPNKDINGESK